MTWKSAPEWAIKLAEQGQTKYGTPAGVTLAVAQLESSFNPNAVNSGSGAMGIMQVLPRFEADYRRYMASIDPALATISLKSQEAMLGLAAVLRYNANMGIKRHRLTGDDVWRWAVVAHRWGQNSDEIDTYRKNGRTLDVERLMRDNGCWYVGEVVPPEPTRKPRTLRNGCQGDDVLALRKQLNKWLVKISLPGSNVFDDDAEAIVELFQYAHGLEDDGEVGALTRTALGKVT